MIRTERMEVFLGIIFLLQKINFQYVVWIKATKNAFVGRVFRLLCRSAKLHFFYEYLSVFKKVSHMGTFFLAGKSKDRSCHPVAVGRCPRKYPWWSSPGAPYTRAHLASQTGA